MLYKRALRVGSDIAQIFRKKRHSEKVVIAEISAKQRT
jgi:hypothetical protein